MSELAFAIKMAVIAFVVVILMQIRVGDESVENHAHNFIQTSAAVLYLREVAEGGLAAVHDGWSKLTSNIKTRYWSKYDSKNAPGQRQLEMTIDRSEAYLEAQKERKDKVEADMAARAKKVKEAIGLDQASQGGD